MKVFFASLVAAICSVTAADESALPVIPDRDHIKNEEGLLNNAIEVLTTPLTHGANLLADGVATVLNPGLTATPSGGGIMGNVLDPVKMLNSFSGVFDPLVRPLVGTNNVRGSENRALHKHKGAAAYSYPVAVPYPVYPRYNTYTYTPCPVRTPGCYPYTTQYYPTTTARYFYPSRQYTYPYYY